MPQRFCGGKLQGGAWGHNRSCHPVFSQLHGCGQEDSERTPERVLQSTLHLSQSVCCGGQRKARFLINVTVRAADVLLRQRGTWAVKKTGLEFSSEGTVCQAVFYLNTVLKVPPKTSTGLALEFRSPNAAITPLTWLSSPPPYPITQMPTQKTNPYLKQSKVNFFLSPSPAGLCNTSYHFPSNRNNSVAGFISTLITLFIQRR